jgi:hypothetical protein
VTHFTRDAPDNPAFFDIRYPPDTGFDLPDIRPDTGYGKKPDIRLDRKLKLKQLKNVKNKLLIC